MPHAWCELLEKGRGGAALCPDLESGITEPGISHLNAFPTLITLGHGSPDGTSEGL